MTEQPERRPKPYRPSLPTPPPLLPAQPVKHDRKVGRKQIFIAILSVFIFFVIVDTFSKSNNKTNATNNTVAPITASPISGQSATTPVNDLALWFVNVSKNVQALERDSGAISDAATAQSIPSLADACVSLKNDVRAFEAAPAAPDAQVRMYLADALDHYSTSATQCLGGDYSAATSEMLSGNQSIAKITKYVTGG